jgi:Cu(I)/Ag(I) efflux system periplasmic protein CusF
MKSHLKTLFTISTLALAAPFFALADDSKQKPAVGATAAADMTDGEVRKLDLEAGKVTLKHAEIKSLDMPAMTMVFLVKDKVLLDKLKAGDKVRFKAINDAGKFTVTDIQFAR